MNALIRNLIAGAASLLAIYPSNDYARYSQRGTPEQRVRGYANRVNSYAFNAAQKLREQAQSKK